MKLKEKTQLAFVVLYLLWTVKIFLLDTPFFTRHDLRFSETIMCIFPNFIVFPPNSKTDKIITLSVHVFQSCPIAYKNILTNVYKNMTLHPFTDRQKALIDNTLFQFCKYASIHGLNFRCITDWRIEITKKNIKIKRMKSKASISLSTRTNVNI